MPYNIRKYDGTSLVIIPDGVVNDDVLSITLVGKNVTDYGTIQNDNFLWLLENFSATTPPPNQIKGQIWFDKTAGILRPKVYDGNAWRSIGITEISATAPDYLQIGDLWFDTSNKQLWVKTSSSFSLIGPELVKGYDNTKWASILVNSTTEGVSYPVISLSIDGQYLMVVSDADFNVSNTESLYIQGLTHIYKGLTLKNSDYALYGQVEDSRYGKLAESENVTGVWSFKNTSGIVIGNNSQAQLSVNPTTNNLLIQNISNSIVLSADSLLPSNNNVMDLGSSSSKFGTLYTYNISAGSSVSTGFLSGDWILTGSSKLHPNVDQGNDLGLSNTKWGTVYTSAVSAGSSSTVGLLEGQWTLTTDSRIISPVVQTRILTAGSTATTGQVIGHWAPAPGSTIQATTIVGTGGAGSADTAANPNTIAERDESADLYANRFYGNFTGNLTGTLEGPVTGSLTGPSYGTHTGPVIGNVTGNLTGNTNGAHSGSVESTSITAGSDITVGNISGFWKLSSASKLQLNYITSGATATLGTIQGDWKLDSGSKLESTHLKDPGSISRYLTTSSIANTVVQRTTDGSVYATNFYGNMVGTIQGKPATAGTADQVANTLTRGSYLTGNNFNGSAATTWAVDATSSNTADKVVVRDSNGEFVCGGISTPKLRAGSSGDVSATGTITGNWTLTGGSKLQATYADVAEKYTSDINYEAGTVVEFGGEKEVTQSTNYMSHLVAGIVSTNPAHLLNSDIDGVAIALSGRVPCKVTGMIKKGSLLISSAIPGVATSASNPSIGTVIAKAMEDYDSTEVGTIEVMVWRG